MVNFNFSNKEKNLWKWFRAHSDELANASSDSLTFQTFYKKLSQIHSSLVFQIGTDDRASGRELVISSDGIREGISAVKKLVEAAPSIEGWKVVAFRQPVGESITVDGGGIKLSTDEILFDYLTAVNNTNTTDVTLYIDGVNVDNNEEYLRVAFILLDAAVGEFQVMTKIGKLDLLPMPKEKGSLYSLHELARILGE